MCQRQCAHRHLATSMSLTHAPLTFTGHSPPRTPSCPCREVAFVLIRPVRRPIDGGGTSGLACRSPESARSIREEAADVHCGSGLLGRPVSESGRFMSLGRGPRRGCQPPEGVDVAYPLRSSATPELLELLGKRGVPWGSSKPPVNRFQRLITGKRRVSSQRGSSVTP